MRRVILFILVFISAYCNPVTAQCDNTLVEKAAARSGSDAIYLREFKVKFDGSERGKAVPVARYPVLLSKNQVYRFNVANAEASEGRVILQLYRKDKLMGSTYIIDTATDLQQFDFTCQQAATYEVVMSFEQGKPGCAVGILSLVQGEIPSDESEELEVLYAGSDNPLTIYDDEDESARIDVTVDNGNVMQIDRTSYMVQPKHAGIAVLTIRVYNRDGSIKELKKKRFAVVAMGASYAVINGIQEGSITKKEIIKAGRLDLWVAPEIKSRYQVASFTISDKNDLVSGISNNSAKITKAQRDFINQLAPGTRLYFKNIQARTPANTIEEIKSIELIIQE